MRHVQSFQVILSQNRVFISSGLLLILDVADWDFSCHESSMMCPCRTGPA